MGWLWFGVESQGFKAVVSHISLKNERDAPNFLHAALEKTACAPFF
jgi:hypothetical protein